MFSVIVPVHNVEQYIEKCIKSILSQKGCDFELILIENASTDKSLEICQRFAEKDDRIKLIVADKAGVSNARNLGIRQAIGEWLVFVDADDYMLDNCLSVFGSAVNNDKCDLIVANYTQADVPEKLSNKRSVITAETYGKAMLDTPRYFSKMENALTWMPGLLGVNWAKAFRRSVVADNNVLFNTTITVFEDLLFNLDFIRYIKNVTCIDTPVYYYRVAEGSLSRNNSCRRVTQRVDYLKCLLNEQLPKSLDEARRFHIGQNLLRTYVVSCRRIWGNKAIRKEITDFIEQKEIQEILCGLRPDNLSNGKVQKKFFTLLLFLLKKRWYSAASAVSWVYAKLKHKN